MFSISHCQMHYFLFPILDRKKKPLFLSIISSFLSSQAFSFFLINQITTTHLNGFNSPNLSILVINKTQNSFELIQLPNNSTQFQIWFIRKENARIQLLGNEKFVFFPLPTWATRPNGPNTTRRLNRVELVVSQKPQYKNKIND